MAELVGVLNDSVLIDYNATGAADGGQLYTIKSAASADSSGLMVVGGNIALGELEVTISSLAYRTDTA